MQQVGDLLWALPRIYNGVPLRDVRQLFTFGPFLRKTAQSPVTLHGAQAWAVMSPTPVSPSKSSDTTSSMVRSDSMTTVSSVTSFGDSSLGDRSLGDSSLGEAFQDSWPKRSFGEFDALGEQKDVKKVKPFDPYKSVDPNRAGSPRIFGDLGADDIDDLLGFLDDTPPPATKGQFSFFCCSFFLLLSLTYSYLCLFVCLRFHP